MHNVFHIGILKPARQTQEYSPTFMEPPPEIIDGHKEYEVEAIKKSQTVRRHTCPIEYLVCWKGYPDPSWEPATNLYPHAEDLIAAFHERFPGAAGPISEEDKIRLLSRSARIMIAYEPHLVAES